MPALNVVVLSLVPISVLSAVLVEPIPALNVVVFNLSLIKLLSAVLVCPTLTLKKVRIAVFVDQTLVLTNVLKAVLVCDNNEKGVSVVVSILLIKVLSALLV